MKITVLSILSIICLFGTSILNAETPNEGASEIHSLIASKNYETLFKTRYSE